MTNTELNVEEIFKSFRETVGNQAQDIAVLKATVAALEATISELRNPPKVSSLKSDAPSE